MRCFFFSILLAGVPLLGAVDHELLQMVPAGARMIGSFDAAQARESTFGQYMLNRMNREDDNLQQFIGETGFDPRRDLQDLIFASSGSRGDDKRNDFAILARGVFDTSQIKAAAKAKGASVRKYHGLEVLVHQEGDERATGLAFPLADVAVFGYLKTVQAILDHGGEPSSLDPELEKLIGNAGASNDAWFASLQGASGFGDHFLPNGPGGDGKAKALQSISRCSGGVHFGSSVDVSFNAVTRSPEDATSLADVFRFGASFVQMQRGKDPRAAIVSGALDRMRLEASGDRMNLSLSLPEKSLEQLAELGPEHHAQ